MRAESLEILEKANVPPNQARAIVRAIELEIDGAQDTLATKNDIGVLRLEFLALRTEMHQEFQALRAETKQEIHAARMEAKESVQALQLDTQKEFQSLRREMAEMHRTLDVRIESVRAEIHSAVGSGTRQLFAVIIGAMAAVLGGVYFLLSHTPR